MNYDSAGKPIKIGDKVAFRGRLYTIAGFGAETARGAVSVWFEEKTVHTDEIPDEWAIDLVGRA